AAEVAKAAAERDPAGGEDADTERVLRPGVEDGHIRDPGFVQEPAQLEVDLASGEPLRVEDRFLPVDLRDAGRLGIGLGEPARVVRDAASPYRCHTSTSRSYGS